MHYIHNTALQYRITGLLKKCITKHHAMKTYWEVELQRHTFFTSALGGE